MTPTEHELWIQLCSLLCNEPDVRHDESEEEDPIPWSVWYEEDILGAGDAMSEAFEDAINTVRTWDPAGDREEANQ